ncbi:MAG: hypothetical protein EZS28_055601 [Streblomastix strix]|uniref:Uncharacterized protein n=1 Tax=Streblomastix strix TaxID=222440 RepID=A0A5J4PYZ8_9EUKA|nr:MAG: hypothetical protein EZS28_055601 [Streblomastix strix]
MQIPRHASTIFTCWNRRYIRQQTREIHGVLTIQCGGMASDAQSKNTGRFAMSRFRKLLTEREHLLNSQLNIVETKCQTLTCTGIGGKTALFAQIQDLIKA